MVEIDSYFIIEFQLSSDCLFSWRWMKLDLSERSACNCSQGKQRLFDRLEMPKHIILKIAVAWLNLAPVYLSGLCYGKIDVALMDSRATLAMSTENFLRARDKTASLFCHVNTRRPYVPSIILQSNSSSTARGGAWSRRVLPLFINTREYSGESCTF